MSGAGSFNHRVDVLREFSDPNGNPIKCSRRNCKRNAVYSESYQYVTGRKGRISRRHTPLCEAHAARVPAVAELPPAPDPLYHDWIPEPDSKMQVCARCSATRRPVGDSTYFYQSCELLRTCPPANRVKGAA